MHQPPDSFPRHSKPLITVTDVVLPPDQGSVVGLVRRRRLLQRRPSDTGSFGGSLADSNSSSSHVCLDSPWAQPNALDKLLSWNFLVQSGDLSVISINDSRSEISTSFCFSTIKDDDQVSGSELNAAIMCVNQDRACELFDLLVEYPDLVEMKDSRGNALIHYAVNRGLLRIIDLLVSRGADVNQRNSQGQTPLHLALCDQQVATLSHLILLGCNAELADNRDVLPIHFACELDAAECLKELLRSTRININAPGEFGGTVVHCCCRKNSTKCLEAVLTMGADMFKSDAIGKYPIHVAVSSGSLECLRLLLEHENTLRTGDTIVGNVGVEGALGFQDHHLIDLPDSEGETALHLAVNSGSAEMIDFCLEHGSDIGAVQNSDCTAIHYAARRGEVVMLSRLLDWQAESAVNLLSCVNSSGHTPLHLAAMYNHAELTTYLVQRGSPMEVQDNNGWTPFLLAISKCATAACLKLIQFGADLHALDSSHRNVLHLAIIYGALKDETLWKQIREHGLFKHMIGEEDEYGYTPLHYATKGGDSLLGVTRELLANGANCLRQNAAHETPLHLAARQGCVATVESLLRTDHGLWSMNTSDAEGHTPLHVAAAHGHAKVVSVLIAKGSSFHRCQKGRTPLHWAAQAGCLDTCKVILGEYPRIIDARDFRGMTALHYAAQNDHHNVVTYLMDSGARFLQDGMGVYFTSLAFRKENVNVARAIVYNKRWNEIIELLNHTDQCPVEQVIREIPSLCPVIMNRYIKEEGNPPKPDYEVTYDFSVLQPKAAVLDRTQRSPLYLLKVMISLRRNELIVHPLCLALLRCKWRRYGLWAHCISAGFYINFLVCLTFLVLDHEPFRHTSKNLVNETCYDLVFETGKRLQLQAILSYCIAFTSAICMVQSMFLIFTEGLNCFKNLINFYSLSVFAVSLTYAAMSLRKATDHHFVELGAVALFLSWSYFVIHLMHFRIVGIFVLMLFQVAKTLGRSAVVVIIVMVSCALPFHVLFKLPDSEAVSEVPEYERRRLAYCFPAFDYIFNNGTNGTDPMAMTPTLSAFQTPQLAILNILSMSLGDFNFVDNIVEPLTDNNPLTMHFPEVTLVIFVIFLLFAPMSLTNLLVGLAVGDIDTVRKQAAIRLLSQTVDWHDRIEAIVPRKVYRLIASSSWTSKSSMDSPSALDLDQEKKNMDRTNETSDVPMLNLTDLRRLLEHQNKEIKELVAILHRPTGLGGVDSYNEERK